MIANIGLLHYISENTYKKICDKLELNSNTRIAKYNFITYHDSAITKIQLYNIKYKAFGHIWFMHIDVNFPYFGCSYDEFPTKLYEAYNELFGPDIMSDFPAYDSLNCDYIEYTDVIEVDNADNVIHHLENSKCVPEQLHRELWDKYKKPHGTIEFCLDKEDTSSLTCTHSWNSYEKTYQRYCFTSCYRSHT